MDFTQAAGAGHFPGAYWRRKSELWSCLVAFRPTPCRNRQPQNVQLPELPNFQGLLKLRIYGGPVALGPSDRLRVVGLAKAPCACSSQHAERSATDLVLQSCRSAKLVPKGQAVEAWSSRVRVLRDKGLGQGAQSRAELTVAGRRHQLQSCDFTALLTALDTLLGPEGPSTLYLAAYT